MSKLNMNDVALPQTTLTVDDVDYLVTSMACTDGLKFMETQRDNIEAGKAPDLALMKQIVCKYAAKDNKQITASSFDVIFARRYQHLHKLYNEIIEYNFASEGFQEDGGEE